jgi:hypothetical protein
MAKGDKVLVFLHGYPFALATVDGDYNYIKEPDEELTGVWFNHFRRVRVQYYADRWTNPHEWALIPMPLTFQRLIKQDGQTYQLIDDWK